MTEGAQAVEVRGFGSDTLGGVSKVGNHSFGSRYADAPSGLRLSARPAPLAIDPADDGSPDICNARIPV